MAAAVALLIGPAGVALAPAAHAAPPVAQVPANHGIPALIDLVESLRDQDRISASTYASLTDRLQRALAQEQTGSEVRTISLLEQFIARVENQVRDAGARSFLIAEARYIVNWLQAEDYDELTGSAQLQEDVTLEGVMEHLRHFQAISDANGGDRASGKPGYDASARHVYELLDAAGYDVRYQDFTYNVAESAFQQVSPDARTYTEFSDFNPAAATGYGDVTGRVVPVDVNNNPQPPAGSSNTSGCEAADFAGFPAGSIALLQRGACDFGLKAQNAAAAGAIGVVLYNEGTPGVADRNNALNPTVAGYNVPIPVVGTTYAIGRDLMDPPNTTVRINNALRTVATRNVIAETPGGNPDNVVMVGGHLDSVEGTPAIDDNGSGSAVLLEVALQMADMDVNNKVRFAWFGAEEEGTLGSDYYVEQLSQAERDKIALYLNFDMIASPNYMRGVFDGTGDLGGTAPRPPGSAAIETMFNRHFGFKGLPYEDTEFSGRSDYAAFINSGIPAGGLFTGAEVPKTAAQVARYGGVAGVSYDPCYHVCDSLRPLEDGADPAIYAQFAAAYGSQLVGNVNTYALDTNADAAAHAVATYAYSTETVNGVE